MKESSTSRCSPSPIKPGRAELIVEHQNMAGIHEMNHPMDNYIVDRIMIDASRVVSLADQQSSLEHSGLRGRFRELLIDGILEPWLPITVKCATGTVISFKNHFRSKTQEDILLIDQSISPSVLIKPHVDEGVYLRNSVLARIEVKSSLDSNGFNGFVKSCSEYHQLRLDLDDERYNAKKINMMEINMLFAFKSPVQKDTIFSWFNSINNGSISSVCILEHGFWKINTTHGWDEYSCQTPNVKAERLAAFVGLTSNTAFSQHIVAQGRCRLSSLESGIGQYFNFWKPIQ